jgi:hypothetical protein
MIYEVAAIFKKLTNVPTLRMMLDQIEDLDEFLQAALYEVISFVVRHEVSLAREGLSKLDGPFIDLRHPEDFAILFDNS